MSIPVLCLPFAGAGPSFFAPWCQHDVPGIEVIALQLPGRERRIAELPYVDVHDAADDLVSQVLELVPEHDEVVLFGHCLGGIIAHELARRLLSHCGPSVVRLVVSGSPVVPVIPAGRRATGIDDDMEFLARIKDFAGYQHEAFSDPEMRELLMPALRADVRMHEEYRLHERDPIAVPITAIRGRDDALVSRSEITRWQDVTRADFTAVELPGGHMYLTKSGKQVLELMARHALVSRPV